jgi:hypothetical protein
MASVLDEYFFDPMKAYWELESSICAESPWFRTVTLAIQNCPCAVEARAPVPIVVSPHLKLFTVKVNCPSMTAWPIPDVCTPPVVPVCPSLEVPVGDFDPELLATPAMIRMAMMPRAQTHHLCQNGRWAFEFALAVARSTLA